MPSAAALARNRAEAPQRAMASQRRRRAVRDVLTGAPIPDAIDPAEIGAAAARQASRQALALARGCFDSALGDNAAALAQKMIELGLEGHPAVLMTIARTIQPPAKYDSTKIELDIGPLNSMADVDRARRRLAEAVFAGRVGVEDAGNLAKLLDSLSESFVRDQQAALLAEMRSALADGVRHGVGGRVAMMADRARLLLDQMPAAEPATIAIDADRDDAP